MSGRIEYRHGSSPEALADLPDGCADAIVTDPPYGTQGEFAGYGRRQLHGGIGRTIANDTDLSQLEAALPAMWRLLRDNAWCVLWCSEKSRARMDALVLAHGFTAIGAAVWDKGNLGLGYTVRYQHESIVLYGKGEPEPCGTPLPSILRSTVSPPRLNRRGGEHPHQKPIDVLRRVVTFAAPAGGLVVDPFAGSASCGVACIAEGRQYVGVECDPQWWPLAEQRMAAAQHQPHPDIEQHDLLTELSA